MATGTIIKLAMGTKEYLVCKVTETLGQLTTLAGAGATYDVIATDEAETVILANQPVMLTGFDPMMALCLIDTTLQAGLPLANIYEEGDYNLFLTFTAVPEEPRLGPFRFRIDD